MAEAVVERMEISAPAEDVFEFWSDRENFCALVRSAEETRRVDLSESHWLLVGPAGRSVEFGPDHFRGCLRQRFGERDPESEVPFGGTARSSSPDIVIGDVAIEVKGAGSGKTHFFLSYQMPELQRRGIDLQLYSLVERLFPAPPNAAGADGAPPPPEDPEAGMTEEDRAWLESDLSDLEAYGPYEWAEGELESLKPVEYVPGVGLVVEEDDEQGERRGREQDGAR